jgi:hypothetical protein
MSVPSVASHSKQRPTARADVRRVSAMRVLKYHTRLDLSRVGSATTSAWSGNSAPPDAETAH